jgi:hypothetical protein
MLAPPNQDWLALLQQRKSALAELRLLSSQRPGRMEQEEWNKWKAPVLAKPSIS